MGLQNRDVKGSFNPVRTLLMKRFISLTGGDRRIDRCRAR